MNVAVHGAPVRHAVERAVARARAAEATWRETPVVRRLSIVRRARHAIARSGAALAASVAPPERRSPGETLTAEVIPLADAMRFLERRARRLLAPRILGRRGRPAWLAGTRAEVHRAPRGVVLVVGPSNYPLLLPGVQALQALVAGNAVLLKPGSGGRASADALRRILEGAGLPAGVLTVLDESVAAAEAAIDAGVDHVVVTGSSDTGRAVLARLAPSLTPATLELGGCDAMFVRADADVELAVRALAFGLRLNHGATCIAPRRVFVAAALASRLERLLCERLAGVARRPVPAGTGARVATLIDDALRAGARLANGRIPDGDILAPVVVADAAPSMAVARADVFAPLVALFAVRDDDDALAQDALCPYALGASIFGVEPGARALASRIRAGVVTINDVIVPTADPRLPFGGRGDSGFGTTRGAEGLLEMTSPRTVVVRAGRFRPHYDETSADAVGLFDGYLRAAHAARPFERLRGLWAAICGARASRRGETR